MRIATGCILLIAVLYAESQAAGPPVARAIPAPVRLPPVNMTSVAPVFVQPISPRDFSAFQPASAVDLDLGLPKGPRPNVGGWIAVGYVSGDSRP